jgi:transcriptional regulator with PAS, ATPase and Fis domain
MAMTDMFLEEFNKKYSYNKIISKKTIDSFLKYNWPGNVRELRNVIERLVITSIDNCIDYQEENVPIIPQYVVNKNSGDSYSISVPSKGRLKDIIDAVEKQYIEHVLQDSKGCVSEAARHLGIHRSAVYRKVQISRVQ